MDMQKTGDFIHAARKKLNMSQRALGEYLRVTDKAVSKWERGVACPDIEILKNMSLLFGCSISDIINGSTPVLEAQCASLHDSKLSDGKRSVIPAPPGVDGLFEIADRHHRPPSA